MIKARPRPQAWLCLLPLLSLAPLGCAPIDANARADAGPLPPGIATSVIRNARIYTGNDAGDFAESMAVRGEEILYVGNAAGLAPFVSAATIELDMQGRLVLPGLHDVHQHTLEAHLPVIDCLVDENITDPEDYANQVAGCSPTGGTGWVLGWGHSILTVLEATRDPRLILDEAFPNTPIAIMEFTSHSTWVNSRALEVLGIDATTPDPQGGLILHNASGEPNGLLIDAAGEYPWNAALAPTARLHTANVAALRDAMVHNSQFGITSAVDARVYTERGYLAAYEEVERASELTTRMVLSLWASPVADDVEQIARLGALFRDDGGLLRVRQIKYYSDGLIENTTAALLEPYSTPDTFGAATGLNYFPEARLQRYITELQALGFDAHIHAIGDRAVRESLNATTASRGLPGGSSARHRLTHVELTHPDDVLRFVAAGVAADMQLGEHNEIAHLSWTADFVGDARTAERAWVLRSLFETGAVVALSSDFDVGDLNPFPSMARALDRGDQSLPDIRAAIRAYTLNAAYIMRSEDRTGSLEVGKLADYIVVDRDVFSATLAELAGTRVLYTALGGREVYRSSGFRP